MGNFLQQPNLEKHESIKSSKYLNASLMSVQGWRLTNEDHHIFELDIE